MPRRRTPKRIKPSEPYPDTPAGRASRWHDTILVTIDRLPDSRAICDRLA